MSQPDQKAERFLPLKPRVLLMLLALLKGQSHGYALKEQIARRTAGRVALGPGTLYRTIRDLLRDGLIEEALAEARVSFSELDGIAATGGPGLIGGVIVGLMAAKGLAQASDKPLIAVNHLEGHALSIGLSETLPFPYLLTLISGGHCQVLAVEGVGQYRLYGTTIDDAIGEAFDKTAKLLSLPYPGGPSVERAARAAGRDEPVEGEVRYFGCPSGVEHFIGKWAVGVGSALI